MPDTKPTVYAYAYARASIRRRRNPFAALIGIVLVALVTVPMLAVALLHRGIRHLHRTGALPLWAYYAVWLLIGGGIAALFLSFHLTNLKGILLSVALAWWALAAFAPAALRSRGIAFIRQPAP